MATLTPSLAQAYFTAVLEPDVPAASSVLRRALETCPTYSAAFESTVTPAMRQLGELRALGELDDADLATAAAISTRALACGTSLGTPHGGRAVVATLDGHELGARCVAAALEASGWTVEFLAAPVAGALVAYTAHERPDLVAVSVSRLGLVTQARALEEQLRALPRAPHVRVGGAAISANLPEMPLNIR